MNSMNNPTHERTTKADGGGTVADQRGGATRSDQAHQTINMKTKRELQHDDWIRRCLLPEGSPARGEDITSKLELALRPFADLDLPIEWCQISAEADCIVLDLDFAPEVNEFGDEIEDAQELFERANSMQDKILRAFRAQGVSCHYVPSGIEFPMSTDQNGRRRLNPLSNTQPSRTTQSNS